MYSLSDALFDGLVESYPTPHTYVRAKAETGKGVLFPDRARSRRYNNINKILVMKYHNGKTEFLVSRSYIASTPLNVTLICGRND